MNSAEQARRFSPVSIKTAWLGVVSKMASARPMPNTYTSNVPRDVMGVGVGDGVVGVGAGVGVRSGGDGVSAGLWISDGVATGVGAIERAFSCASSPVCAAGGVIKKNVIPNISSKIAAGGSHLFI